MKSEPDPLRSARRLLIVFMLVVVFGLALYLAIANPHSSRWLAPFAGRVISRNYVVS